MNKKLIFCLCIVLCIITCIGTLPFSAYSYECPVEVTSDAVLVANLDTDTFVFEKNIDKKRYLSHMVNIMSFIVVRNNVKDIEETVKIKQELLDSIPNSDGSLNKYAGKTLKVKDLLYFIMLTDGHDASYVLADYISNGNIKAFVKLMNKKAKDLGCKNTRFVEPACVENATQVTSCADMYKIIKCALETPDYKEIAGTYKYQPEGYKSKSAIITSTNSLINDNSPYYFKYIENGKFATDSVARGNVIAESEYSDVHYVCIIFGAQQTSEHNAFTETKKLLTWTYTTLGNKKIISDDDVIATVTAHSSWGSANIELVTGKNIIKTLPADLDMTKISYSYNDSKTVNLPVFKGQNIGIAQVYFDGEYFDDVNLISSSSEGVSILEDLASFAGNMFDKTFVGEDKETQETEAN